MWAAPANLTQQGGTAQTIDTNGIDRFDGTVFGELERQARVPSSNGYSCTEPCQADWPAARVSLHLPVLCQFRQTQLAAHTVRVVKGDVVDVDGVAGTAGWSQILEGLQRIACAEDRQPV